MPPNARRIVRSWSNRSLIVAASEFISAYPEAIVLGSTYLAGEALVHTGLAQTTRGAAGVHRMTLVQLAADLARAAMAERGLAPLNTLGLEAIAARVVYEARAADALQYFGPVAALPGFARALARTLGEVRLAKLHPDDLAAGGQPGGDLAGLLARYEVELENRSLADLTRTLELAGEAAETEQHRWLGLPVLLLDAPLDSCAHRDFFARFVTRAPAVLAAVTSGEGAESARRQPWQYLEEILSVAAEDLDRQSATPSAAASSLDHLRANLFSVSPSRIPAADSGFDLFSAPGEGLEAVEIARRILALAREGVAFDSIAILLRSPERYQPMIEDALRRAKIPAYFSRGIARPDPGGRAFLALLACAAEKCSASRFAEYLSLGQVPAASEPENAAVSPKSASANTEWVGANDELLGASDSAAPAAAEIDQADADEGNVPRAPAGWEKLLVDAAVIGGRDRWARRLRGLEQEFELRRTALEHDDEPRRAHLARQIEQLKHLNRFALPLIDVLAALPKDALWSEWLAHLANLARIGLRDPSPVLAVLAEFEPMGEVGPASLEEVAEVLSERLSFLRRDPPPRRYGHVFIGSIDESRGCEYAVVFLPGLAEGLFPQRALEDPLLLDEFRRATGDSLPLRDDRAAQERLRLRLAVAAARDRLIASYPRMDVAEARPRVPSFYALELPRAMEGRLPELKVFEQRARDAVPARLNWPAPHTAVEAIDDAEYDLVTLRQSAGSSVHARYLVDSNPHLARSLRARWRRWETRKWNESDGLLTSDTASLEALAGHRLTARPWSPSALQKFAVCPYKFALHGIYGLRPREEAEPIEQMDPLTRGAFFHEVQFALLGELKSGGLLPLDRDRLAGALDICDRVLDRVAAGYEETLAPAIPSVWRSEIEGIRTDLRGWLQHVASNDDDWEPVHFEFGVGLRANDRRDAASTIADATLAEGVRLRGSIDLLERHVSRPVWRVTDHKTGALPDRIPLYVGGGNLLQPLLYSLAARQLLGVKIESGRLFYATQRGGYQHVTIAFTDKARQFVGRLLETVDNSIAQGFLPPSPGKDACGICDYRVVCGPYEERRLKKKDQLDERLDGLTEIRGMP